MNFFLSYFYLTLLLSNITTFHKKDINSNRELKENKFLKTVRFIQSINNWTVKNKYFSLLFAN